MQRSKVEHGRLPGSAPVGVRLLQGKINCWRLDTARENKSLCEIQENVAFVTTMGKFTRQKIQEQVQKQQAAQQAYWAQLQASCPPGIKLMTCPHCGYLGKFPEWQQMVSCVRIGTARPQHPGEFKR
jgi:hypothetical protein